LFYIQVRRKYAERERKMFDEILFWISGNITILVIVILVTLAYYKLKLKRLNLIEKGLWKSEYETKQPESMIIVAAVLVAIGSAVLLTDYTLGETKLCTRALATLNGSIFLFVGIALAICVLIHRRMTTP